MRSDTLSPTTCRHRNRISNCPKSATTSFGMSDKNKECAARRSLIGEVHVEPQFEHPKDGRLLYRDFARQKCGTVRRRRRKRISGEHGHGLVRICVPTGCQIGVRPPFLEECSVIGLSDEYCRRRVRGKTGSMAWDNHFQRLSPVGLMRLKGCFSCREIRRSLEIRGLLRRPLRLLKSRAARDKRCDMAVDCRSLQRGTRMPDSDGGIAGDDVSASLYMLKIVLPMERKLICLLRQASVRHPFPTGTCPARPGGTS